MTAYHSLLHDFRRRLLAARAPGGPWRSRLSSSALANAVAVIALMRLAAADGARAPEAAASAARGLAWLVEDQNADGGFGDTPESASNPSTSLLAWGALGLHPGTEPAIRLVESYLREHLGELDPASLSRALRRVYGDDQTFSVPILAALALAGRLGDGAEAWRHVPALPFELAAVPHRWWALVDMRVVSYALPALIAIGQARHHHRPPLPPLRWVRDAVRARTLAQLEATQPATGGWLEAVPLTAFVLMALVGIEQARHPVVACAGDFLLGAQRPDGSWPIDVNLDTWVTSLSIGALGPSLPDVLDSAARETIRRFLLDQQLAEEHPFTHAAPGGWAWTDLPGGVPDADDTPAALLALHALGAEEPEARAAAARGVRWLLDLQNADGGMPTFCRGWGRLPFDAGSPDLTAHSLRAWTAWRPALEPSLATRVDSAQARAIAFLLGRQRADGSWVPLWFGSQLHPEGENPLYGTTRVLRAAAALQAPPHLSARWNAATAAGVRWLLAAQDPGGGWGAAAGVGPTVEETALALEALAELRTMFDVEAAIEPALRWLAAQVNGVEVVPSAPIGLYFAQLWYDEGLYPLIWSVSALERLKETGA